MITKKRVRAFLHAHWFGVMGGTLGVGVSLFTLCSLYGHSPVYADTPAAGIPGDNTLTAQNLANRTIPALDVANYQQSLSNLFASCNFATTALPPTPPTFPDLASYGNQIMSMRFGNQMIPGSCGTETELKDDLTCDDFSRAKDGEDSTSTNVDAFFDPNIYATKRLAVEASFQTLSCKQSKFQQLLQQLDCLGSRTDFFNSQLSSLQRTFNDNMTQMRRDVQAIEDTKNDRGAQIQAVDGILKGKDGGGKPGLLDVEKKFRDELSLSSSNGANSPTTSLPAAVSWLKETQKKEDDYEKSFQSYMEAKKISMAMDCLRLDKNPSFICRPGDAPGSFSDVLMCRYEQYQHLAGNTGGGKTEVLTSSNANNQAAAQAQRLQTVLSNLYSEVSVSDLPPFSMDSNSQSAGGLSLQGVKVLSLNELKKKYAAQLAALNMSQLPVKELVFSNLDKCYSKSTTAVTRDFSQPGGDLYAKWQNLSAQKRSVFNQANDLLKGFGRDLSDARQALTGTFKAPDFGHCLSDPIVTKANCIATLQGQMQGLLDGSSPDSQMPISLSGINPQSSIKFNCSGISGCIATLNNVKSNLTNEITRLDRVKTQYMDGANKAIQDSLLNMKDVLKAPLSVLKQQQDMLSSLMAMLGVPDGLKIEFPQAQDCPLPKNDPTQLMGMPDDILCLVGAPKMSPNPFMAAKTAIANQVNDLGKRAAKAQAQRVQMVQMGPQCRSQAYEKVLKKLSEGLKKSMDNLSNWNCYKDQKWCAANKMNLDYLMADMSTINQMGGGDTNLGATLGGGMGSCSSENGLTGLFSSLGLKDEGGVGGVGGGKSDDAIKKDMVDSLSNVVQMNQKRADALKEQIEKIDEQIEKTDDEKAQEELGKKRDSLYEQMMKASNEAAKKSQELYRANNDDFESSSSGDSLLDRLAGKGSGSKKTGEMTSKAGCMSIVPEIAGRVTQIKGLQQKQMMETGTGAAGMAR